MRVVLWALSTLAWGKSGQSGGVTYKMEAVLLFLPVLPLLPFALLGLFAFLRFHVFCFFLVFFTWFSDRTALLIQRLQRVNRDCKDVLQCFAWSVPLPSLVLRSNNGPIILSRVPKPNCDLNARPDAVRPIHLLNNMTVRDADKRLICDFNVSPTSMGIYLSSPYLCPS